MMGVKHVIRTMIHLVGLLMAFAAVACQDMNESSGVESFDEDFQRGEALYSINLNIAKSNKEHEIASSIFAQDILAWKASYMEKHGMKSWLKAREHFIKKYGYSDKLKWFLGSCDSEY